MCSHTQTHIIQEIYSSQHARVYICIRYAAVAATTKPFYPKVWGRLHESFFPLSCNKGHFISYVNNYNMLFDCFNPHSFRPTSLLFYRLCSVSLLTSALDLHWKCPKPSELILPFYNLPKTSYGCAYFLPLFFRISQFFHPNILISANFFVYIFWSPNLLTDKARLFVYLSYRSFLPISLVLYVTW